MLPGSMVLGRADPFPLHSVQGTEQDFSLAYLPFCKFSHMRKYTWIYKARMIRCSSKSSLVASVTQGSQTLNLYYQLVKTVMTTAGRRGRSSPGRGPAAAVPSPGRAGTGPDTAGITLATWQQWEGLGQGVGPQKASQDNLKGAAQGK